MSLFGLIAMGTGAVLEAWLWAALNLSFPHVAAGLGGLPAGGKWGYRMEMPLPMRSTFDSSGRYWPGAALAPVYLDRRVHDAKPSGHELLIMLRCSRVIGHHTDCRRVDPRSDAPDMEIGKPIIGVSLDGVAQIIVDRILGLAVEEHPTRVPK